MRLVICWLMLLPLVTAAPIRARRENVLSFLKEALGTTAGKTISAIMTAHKNPPSEPKKEHDSQDLSEDQSFESANQDTLADLDSDEMPQTKENAKAPPRRQTGAVRTSSRRAQDQQSGEHADLHSETDITDGVNMSSIASVQGSSLQRKASAEGLRSLAPSRETVDQASLETRPAAVVGETDDDETKELMTSESHSFGPGLRRVGIYPS
ncbi:uncharacterized protein LOC133401755 isoform X2 [Phycodurus eques]|uniref:uncharacterized protein LOC133401755 isoform X2 n=1 Tax=Phycodurus eques TaxID=693459 RepID=UPI002ACE62ED|nr:uncharacterized protein LOC133401755 isoform X2 [Phycodurus eques]